VGLEWALLHQSHNVMYSRINTDYYLHVGTYPFYLFYHNDDDDTAPDVQFAQSAGPTEPNGLIATRFRRR
jgi:hypothetical protein